MDKQSGQRGLLLESRGGQNESRRRWLKVVDLGRLFLSE